VVSLTDYGAFIEIEKGIEGLIHNSEMSWTQHVRHPSQMVSMGQIVDAVVLSLDKEDKKISLGMKQLEPDPWQELLQKYPVGSTHKGIARNLTNFGVFVELEPGVDGLVHISDLSWTKKIRHPGEVVKKSESLEVVVLSVDIEQRKISLGHKQVYDNPWERFGEVFAVGTTTTGKIVRIIEKGIIVELPQEVDGFVPTTQLSTSRIKNLALHFPIDAEMTFKVIEFEKESKKIVLSSIAWLKQQDDSVIQEYITKYKLEKMNAQDVITAEPTVEPTDFTGLDIIEERGGGKATPPAQTSNEEKQEEPAAAEQDQ
jgi:small subunit ribosomal protein S1